MNWKIESLRDAYSRTLIDLGHLDERVMVFDADLSSSTKTWRFGKEFPERFFNMGISEQSMVTAAAGAALSGKVVFASTFAVFLSRAYEQIRQSICYNRANVKFVTTHAGITVGEDGATHQMIEDVGIMSGLPVMSVVVPADSVETVSMLYFLHDKTDGPFYVRLSREKFPVINDDDYEFRLGHSTTLRDGSDLTIFSYGATVSLSLQASEILASRGVDARVINMSSIKPLDSDAVIKASVDTGRIITVEEHSIINGLGSRVAEVLSENKPSRLVRMGMRDEFGKSGHSWELFDYFHIGVDDIVKTSEKLMKEV